MGQKIAQDGEQKQKQWEEEEEEEEEEYVEEYEEQEHEHEQEQEKERRIKGKGGYSTYARVYWENGVPGLLSKSGALERGLRSRSGEPLFSMGSRMVAYSFIVGATSSFSLHARRLILAKKAVAAMATSRAAPSVISPRELVELTILPGGCLADSELDLDLPHWAATTSGARQHLNPLTLPAAKPSITIDSVP